MTDSIPDRSDIRPSPLPPGLWLVDPTHSTATFSSRGFWGAVPVTGRFEQISGTIAIEADGGVEGAILIPIGTLVSGIGLRDRHLRSAAFFDVGRYPEIGFAVRSLVAAGAAHMLEGTLSVLDRSLDLRLLIRLSLLSADRMEVAAETTFDRATLGLDHSPLGTIRGDAAASVRLVLGKDVDTPSRRPGPVR